ncbi:MAG: family 14 glycosylhydrolase [Lentisphaeria bacterium]|nr:family 14 glycosylhydrolase [Lentisphaeria bacterium]
MMRRWFRMVAMVCGLSGMGVGAAELPELVLDFSRPEASSGLRVPSGGDGVNRPERVAGRVVQRGIPESLYFYVRVDDPRYEAAAPLDLLVTAEVADDDFNRVSVQYDRAAAEPNIGTQYTQAEGTAVLVGGGGWRALRFRLPAARLGHGQNHGSDFRFCARGLAVASIRVRPLREADPESEAGMDAASLEALRTERPAGMELTFGNDAGAVDAAIYRALSVSSVESYVDWAGVEPDREGEWDWSKWDRQVAILRQHDLKWVPFLIAGPAYATPLWFQNSDRCHTFRCLEHGLDSKVQSIFNPALRPGVDRFLGEFARRYRDTGVIESVLLGVTGIYGESIYPAGPEDGWTARLTGTYHNHGGWWAADTHAQAAFRAAMRRQYRWLWRLNRAWGTRHDSFEDVQPFLPGDAPSDRARADMAEWYQEAMEAWSVFWVETARRHFPDTPIYLCTGGNGTPSLGADFTAQAKAIAPYGAGIRITNEASAYAANFTVTREVATATRLYGTFAGFEPAGQVDPDGVVARIYNATASGVRQLHYYSPNVLQSRAALTAFRLHAGLLAPRQPRIEAALYVSRETWSVNAEALPRMYAHARELRDLVDYDMVTRRSVVDGVLRGRRFLLLVESEVLDEGAAAAIRRWVRGGGVLVVATRSGETVASRLDDLASWRRGLLAAALPTSDLFEHRLTTEAPAAWELHLGTEADDAWLFGDWSHRERGSEWPGEPDARKRWSGANPGIRLPVQPGRAYALELDAHLAAASLGDEANCVLVNGIEVGRLDRAGSHTYTFAVSPEAVGDSPLARLEFHLKTWVPAQHGSSTDTRELGMALHRLRWRVAGHTGAAGEATITAVLAAERLRPLVRRVGDGWTVHLGGLADRPDGLVRVLAPLLAETGTYLAGEAPLAPSDGRLDGIYTTVLQDGVLVFDSRRSVIVERHGAAAAP